MEQQDRELYSDIDETTKERILTFMDSMDDGMTPFLRERQEEALKDNVPIIRGSTQRILRFFLAMTKPKKILEIGTATGFSALYFLTFCPKAEITTIEKDEERIRKAKENFALGKKAGLDTGRIHQIEGDALEALKEMKEDESFDFIFLDAAKGQYPACWPEVKRLLKEGGILVSDDVLSGGVVLPSRFAVPHRERTIHQRMRDYLYTITHDGDCETLLLQEGDGTAVTFRKRKTNGI